MRTRCEPGRRQLVPVRRPAPPRPGRRTATQQVVNTSLDLLDDHAAARRDPARTARSTAAALVPRPGWPTTPLTVPGHLAVWEQLGSAPSDAIRDIGVEAADFSCALLRVAAGGAAGQVRRGHDLVLVPLLAHVGFFEVEGLSAAAESTRTGVVDLLLRLDRIGLELETGW